MQTSQDPRHEQREKRMQILFEWDFRPHEINDTCLNKLIAKISQIDELINRNAPMWKIEDMARIDVAILRLAINEMLLNEVPKKTVIDEAIELAKSYGNEKSPGFINGTLDRIYASNFSKQEA